jgi:Bacteriophage tail sheath protein
MPEYLSPAVYVEEVSGGIKPIEGVGTSTGAFIGIAEKGPIAGVKYEEGPGRPVLVTNFSEYQRTFGGFVKGEYLAYAVQQFFGEGGTRCYVARTVHFDENNNPTAVRASVELAATEDLSPPATLILNVRAINEGEWGNNLRVGIAVSGRITTRLDGNVAEGATTARLEDVSLVQPGMTLSIFGDTDTASVQVTRVDAATRQITFVTLTPAALPALGDDSTVIAMLPGRTSTVLNGAAADGASSALLQSVEGIGIGSILLIGSDIPDTAASPPASPPSGGDLDRVVVTRVLGKEVFFTPPLGAGHADRTRVTTEDFTLTVYDGDEVVETFTGLSMEDTNELDYVTNRINLSAGKSKYIRVQELAPLAANSAPARTSAPVALSGGSNGDPEEQTDYIGSQLDQTGFYAFDTVDDINIVAAPGITYRPVILQGMTYCENRKDCFFVGDVPLEQQTATEVLDFKNGSGAFAGEQALSSKYGALYWPWIRVLDPLTARPISMPPSGAVIGSYSATDVRRGVHKAPAGIDDGFLNTAIGIEKVVTMGEHDVLNPQGVNVIRSLANAGIVIWGARTTSSDPEWKYINVRRLFLFLEESIYKGTQWVVFEPNDQVLWKRIVTNITAFLRVQWLEGKLVGDKAEKAFFVKCDEETNPPESVDLGRVITVIGVAPSKPAEFVIFRIMQARPGAK